MTLLEYWQQNKGTFAEGVALVKIHCPGALTKKMLQRLNTMAVTGETPGEYELGKLTNALKSTEAPDGTTIAPSIDEPEPMRESVTVQGNSPSTTARAKELHKSHAHVHATMVTADTDADRADAAREIMGDIIPELDAEYDKLREGDTTAEKPAHTPVDFRKLHSLRTRIARLKKIIPNQKNAQQKAKLEAELADKLAQKAKLEQA